MSRDLYYLSGKEWTQVGVFNGFSISEDEDNTKLYTDEYLSLLNRTWTSTFTYRLTPELHRVLFQVNKPKRQRKIFNRTQTQLKKQARDEYRNSQRKSLGITR